MNLTLNVKKKWFDMILSGIKKEEYREIKQLYIGKFISHTVLKDWDDKNGIKVYKQIDNVIFLNGMKKLTPTIVIECVGIDIGKAVPEWSDNWQGEVFRIKLGNIISTKNIVINPY